MSAVYPLQTSFAGGELSPRLAARVDTERYRQSVAEYINYYSTPQGSAFKRPGSQYFFPTLNGQPARLVQFSRGRESDYVIEFSDGFVRMFDRDGVVQNAGGEELTNPEFSQGSDGLFGWTTVSFLTQLVGPETVEQTVMEIEASSPRFTVTQLADAIGEDGAPSNFVDLSQSVTVDEDPLNPGTWLPHTMATDYVWAGDSNVFTIRILIGDGTTEDAYADVTYSELSTGNGSFPIIFTPLGPTVTLKYEFRLPTTPTGDPNFAIIENLSLKPQINDPLLLVSPYSGEQLFELDVVMDLGGDATGPDRLWIAHPEVEPYLLTRVSRNDWTLAPVVFTMPPPTWTTDNYPSTVELFAGRSWFSGVQSDRARLWSSKAGDYFDFTPGSSAGDALDLNLITRGAIQWIKGQKALLLGTDLAEHTVQSSTAFNTLQVGDIDVLEQSANGSVPIEPLIIANEVVYLSPDQTKVFATDYLRTNDGWISVDLTWFAEHITRQGITRHIWARDPDNQLICIMADGKLTNCVYDRRRETVGWSTFETQGLYKSGCVTNDLAGSSKWYCVERTAPFEIQHFYTITAGTSPLSANVKGYGGVTGDLYGSIDTDAYLSEQIAEVFTNQNTQFGFSLFGGTGIPDDIFESVEIPGVTNGKLFAADAVISILGSGATERKIWRWTGGSDFVTPMVDGTDYDLTVVQETLQATNYIETVQAGEVNNQYMDSWISAPTVDKVVDNLDHLEGLTVQVLVNGAVEPDKVVEGGQITTEGDGNAVAGLMYTASMQTLRTEGGNQAGTSQVSLMDFSEVHLRLNNSAVPSVNGQTPPLRSPLTPMNTPTPLTDTDAVTWQLGRENKGQLTIEQDLPLRTEIVAIYGKLRSSTV